MTHSISHLTQKLQFWSYRRQHLNRTAASPSEALRNIIGVYSSHPVEMACLC